MIRPTACCVVLAGVVAAALAAGSFASGSTGPQLVWRSQPGYRVQLPKTWRFADATYPSDHSTHLWFDPQNALRKLTVVVSGCVGCVTTNADGKTPNPRSGVPAGASKVSTVNRWKVGFVAFTPDDPYPDRGWVIVLHDRSGVQGSTIVQLWLPKSQQGTATRILNSFSAS